MNPSFNFVFGRPANEGPGRWVEGEVAEKGSGYKFTAHLMLRLGATLSCQRVSLEIDRPFVASDFAAYLRLVSTGPFATARRTCGLYETSGVDAAAAAAIFKAAAEWVYPWEHESLPLLEELALLGDQLEQARKREALHLALAGAGRGTRTFDGSPE